jgi:predicted glycoside hydrolase/deacetylase ChbG (UPF0249 family)
LSGRRAIVHVDDVGMCQATLPAFAELLAAGTVTAGSVMVPCPWFPEAAAWCRANPAADVGVHLTLTSEWSGYRWGPLSTRDPASGLLDDDGFFHRLPSAVHEQASLDAVGRELRAQLDRAVAAGIAVTHIDSHMYALFHPRLLPLYLGLAAERRLPALIHGDAGVDHLKVLRLDGAEDSMAYVKDVFSELKPGLTQLLLHPAIDTPELRAVTPGWRARVAEYEIFRSAELQRFLRSCGVELRGYRVTPWPG